MMVLVLGQAYCGRRLRQTYAAQVGLYPKSIGLGNGAAQHSAAAAVRAAATKPARNTVLA